MLEKRSDNEDEVIYSNCLVGNYNEGEDSLMVADIVGTVVKSKKLLLSNQSLTTILILHESDQHLMPRRLTF